MSTDIHTPIDPAMISLESNGGVTRPLRFGHQLEMVPSNIDHFVLE